MINKQLISNKHLRSESAKMYTTKVYKDIIIAT